MLIFVNNLNILTTLYLYNIHQSLIRKSVLLFEIMNAHILLRINCLMWHFRIYACIQIVTLCGFNILNNDNARFCN